MKPTFLFGSGISPAPGVADLTERILNAPMSWHSDGRWRLSPATPSDNSTNCPSNDPIVIRELLMRIRRRICIAQERQAISSVNYEDIANVCAQLNHDAGTLRNPALQPFVDALRFEMKLSVEDFHQACWNAVRWIKWGCWEYLREPPEGSGTSAIIQFRDQILGHLDSSEIVTLNHDLYLDLVLGDSQVAGFSRSAPFQFHPELLNREGHRLLKLHGSIDWFNSSRNEPTKRIPEGDAEGPAILSGTISKLEDYNYGPFPWLWAEFQNALRCTRRLVVCGYGFKDLGVNSRLTDWLNHYPDARMLVLHGEPDQLIVDCEREPLAGVCNFFDQVSTEPGETSDAQITIAPHWFEDTSRSIVAEQILRFVQT